MCAFYGLLKPVSILDVKLLFFAGPLPVLAIVAVDWFSTIVAFLSLFRSLDF